MTTRRSGAVSRRARALLAGGMLAIGLAAATVAPGGALAALTGAPSGAAVVAVDEDRSGTTADAEMALFVRKQGGEQQEY